MYFFSLVISKQEKTSLSQRNHFLSGGQDTKKCHRQTDGQTTYDSNTMTCKELCKWEYMSRFSQHQQMP